MKIQFTFITDNKRLLGDNFIKFLDIGTKNLLMLNRYDYKEPLKHKIERDNLEDILKVFNNYSGIILKGKNKSFIISQISNVGITYWSGSVTVKKNMINQVNELIRLIEIFSKNNQLIYGFIANEEEYDLKHKITTEYSYGWQGISISDFQNFLPGIYWYTYFGEKLVDAIGAEKLLNIESVIYSENLKRGIAFHLDEPIYTSDWEARADRENKIEKTLGPFFYSKHNTTYSHPEMFKKYLESLQFNK